MATNRATQGTLSLPDNAEVEVCQNPKGANFKKVSSPIFDRTPSFDDVRQGAYGDCFLLGAFFSLLSLQKGEEIILGMIKEENDRVIVRVFDSESKPHYLSLEKSLPAALTGVSSRARWVQFIEKAYAVFHGGDYKVLNGGSQALAMMTLSGARDKGDCALPLQSRKPLAKVTEFVNADGIYLFYELMRVSDKTPKRIQERICKTIFSNDEDDLSIWQKWLQADNRVERWQQFLVKHHPITINDVEQFLQALQPDNDMIKPILQWIKDNKVLSGAPLSATYSQEELNLYDAIKDKLANAGAIFVGKRVGGFVQQDISSNHAYTVIGVEESSLTPHKYVHVRTPVPNMLHKLPSITTSFFKIGRSAKETYHQKADSCQVRIIKSTKVSEAYRMELNDFCRSFDTIYSTNEITQKAIDQRIENANDKKRQYRSN